MKLPWKTARQKKQVKPVIEAQPAIKTRLEEIYEQIFDQRPPESHTLQSDLPVLEKLEMSILSFCELGKTFHNYEYLEMTFKELSFAESFGESIGKKFWSRVFSDEDMLTSLVHSVDPNFAFVK